MSHHGSRRHGGASAGEGFAALFGIIDALLQIPLNIRSAQRRIDMETAHCRLDEQRAAESRQKQQVVEAEIALRNNRAVVADLEIEIKKLQLEKLKRELGLNDAPFEPKDYPS